MTRTLRLARPDDLDDVAAMTADTWPDQSVGDYLPDVFETWATSEDPDDRTLVAEVDGTVVGLCHAALPTTEEGWLEGIRVHPDHRGAGHGQALTEALLDWCADRGATVARDLVHAWNEAGLGQSRTAGFEPVTACRWARPEPAAVTVPNGFTEDPAAAWRYWTDSDAREHLGGLTVDTDHSWVFAELTRDRLDAIADSEDGRVLALVDGGIRGMAVRTRTVEIEAGDAADGCDDASDPDTETIAEYGVAAGDGLGACRRILDAIRADAASIGADATRVWHPETAEALSDVAAAGAPLADDAMVVLAADLTNRS
jgi:GNAT superfamily N-acetyltransferase